MNKRATLEIEPQEDWPELIAFILLVLGFVLSIGTSVVVNYILIILAGLAFGRTFSQYEKRWPFTTILIVLGFVGGFLLGAFHTDRKLILVLFALAVFVSYFIHRKGYIASV